MDAVKGANPFLIDDYSSPPSNPSNPFLMEDNEFASVATFCDNPFLSEAPPATIPTSVAPANNATNPFAFDPMEYAPVEATPAEEQHTMQPTQPNDIFGGSCITEEHIQQNNADFFSMDAHEAEALSCPPVTPFATPLIQKPAALDLKHAHTITRIEPDINTNLYSSNEELSKMAAVPVPVAPRRPPPPRPVAVPPSKETQDLIMSVTGAMDATSSHLLDRIPPTRTPSPVSMRDLHSPSPTPDHAFADFLDVGGPNNKTQMSTSTTIQSNTTTMDTMNTMDTMDFFDVNDINDTHPSPNDPDADQLKTTTDPFISLMTSTQTAQVCDINQNHSNMSKPSPEVPIRPPRPQPPQKPPPPVLVRPTPPAIPPQPVHQHVAPLQVVSSLPQDDMMDMFGETELPQTAPPAVMDKPVASTADIMSLYSSAPPVMAKPVILSQPKTEAEPSNNIIDFFGENTSTVITETETDNKSIIMSPEQSSQHDLHMDTSDTQSKGSASSVTFNPFASEEPVVGSMIDTTTTTTTTSDQIENDHFIHDNNTSPAAMFAPTVPALINDSIFGQLQPKDDFDDFAAKFESAAKDDTKNGAFDPFGSSSVANSGVFDSDTGTNNNSSAWGDMEETKGFSSGGGGFDADEPFDAFLSLQEPPAPPQGTPSMLSKRESQESDEDKDFSVVIKPKIEDDFLTNTAMPVLAPPPKSPVQNSAFSDTPRLNPFDQQAGLVSVAAVDQTGVMVSDIPQFQRTDSQETPPTPLFDDDVSQPLEDYPRVTWAEEGWEMQLRQPNKKKITGQRFWKKIFVKLIMHEDCPILQLFNTNTDKDAFQELPLQPCYSVSDIGAQQYDNYGKIFTVKLQYIFYKERPGVRPGQVTKAERITNKLSQFAAYAIQGDYQGVKEFGSDLKKLGLPVEHAPQVSQLLKLGSLNFEDMKQFSVTIEEALFHLSAHRDRALHYKMEEVQVTAVDELYVEQNAEGFVEKQIARVRLFFLGFLSGMPDVELGVNDMRRQGKEVVGRHDIIPVVTEEWIRLEAVEFAACVQQDEYHNTHIIKFKPPDACYIELMRFRIRPPKNRELPLQLKPVMCITGNKVEIRADCLVPGFASRKLGQVPCEDVMIRIPIPECWIYLFRVEKHFRYGSVKSTHRRTGKVKGIERFLGTVETLQESLIEVTSGQAKYEHQHRAIVWRIPRLPKEGQGAYTTHNLVCRLALTSYDQVPDQLADYCYVEFTMPATQASHTTVRSVSLQNSQSDDPPEKYVRYLARHEYRVGIEHTEGEDPNPYAAATAVSRTPAPLPEEPAELPAAVVAAADPESSSDSD